MSISDHVVVMQSGVVQQMGKPQEVYDDPKNLFVAKFLGTPPINVFSGKVEGGKLYIGGAAVLDAPIADCDVHVGVRPEGFVLDENGPLVCRLERLEVMGRDSSVVATHSDSENPIVRAIIPSDSRLDLAGGEVRFALKPHKVDLFDKVTEERIYG